VEFTNQFFSTMAFSPDGRILATATRSAEPVIRLWDTGSGILLRTLAGHRAYVTDVLWLTNTALASASADQTIRLWDLTKSNDVSSSEILRGHQREVVQLARLPEHGSLLSASRDGSVCVWSMSAARPVDAQILIGNLHYWFFGPDSKSLYTFEWTGSNTLVTRRTGPRFENREVIHGMGYDFYFDNRRTASGSDNGVIAVWDLAQPGPPRRFTVGTGNVSTWHFVPQRDELVFEGPERGARHLLDLNTGRVVWSWRPATNLVFEIVAGNARWYALGDGTFYREPLESGRKALLDRNVKEVADSVLSPDGRLLAIGNSLGTIKVWDTLTVRQVATLGGILPDAVSLWFSPDNRRLSVCSNKSGEVKLWDIESQQELITLKGSCFSFPCSAFSPDGHVVGAIGWPSGTLNLWRAPSWQEIEAAEKATAMKVFSTPQESTAIRSL
jgi:WD40 repeat protein